MPEGPGYVVVRMPDTYQGLPSGRLRPDWEDRLNPNMRAAGVTEFSSENYPPTLIRHTLFYLQNGGFIDSRSPDGFNRDVVQLIETNLKTLGYLPANHRANGSFDQQSLNALTRFTRDQAPGRTVQGLNGNGAFEGGAAQARVTDVNNWMEHVAPAARRINWDNPSQSRADVLYVQYLDMHYGWNNVTSLDGNLGPQTTLTAQGQIKGMNFNADANRDGRPDILQGLQTQSNTAVAAARRAAEIERNFENNNMDAQQEAFQRRDWAEVRRLEDERLEHRGINVAEERARRGEAVRAFEEARHAAANDPESMLLFVPGANLGVMMRDPGFNNALRDTGTFIGAAAGTVAELAIVTPVRELITGERETRNPIFGDNSMFKSNETWFRERYNDVRDSAGDITFFNYHPLRMNGGGSDWRFYKPEDYALGNKRLIVDNTVIPVNGRLSDNRQFELEASEFPLAILNRDGSIQRIVTNTGPVMENGVLRNPEWNMYGSSYIASNVVISAASFVVAPASLDKLKNATTLGERVGGALLAVPAVTEQAETIIGLPMLAGAGYDYIKFRFFEDHDTPAPPAVEAAAPQSAPATSQAAPAVATPQNVIIYEEIDPAVLHQANMNILEQVTSPSHLVDQDTGSFDHQKIEELQNLLSRSGYLSSSYVTGTINIHTMRAIETAIKAAINPSDITEDQRLSIMDTTRAIAAGLQENRPESDSFDVRVLTFQANAYFAGLYQGRIDGLAGSSTMAAIEQANIPAAPATELPPNTDNNLENRNTNEQLSTLPISRQRALVLEGP